MDSLDFFQQQMWQTQNQNFQSQQINQMQIQNRLLDELYEKRLKELSHFNKFPVLDIRKKKGEN